MSKWIVEYSIGNTIDTKVFQSDNEVLLWKEQIKDTNVIIRNVTPQNN